MFCRHKAEDIQRKVSIFRQMLIVKEHIAIKIKQKAQPIYEEDIREEGEKEEAAEDDCDGGDGETEGMMFTRL